MAKRRGRRATSTRRGVQRAATTNAIGTRSGWKLKDGELERLLRSGEHEALLESYFGADGYRELREFAQEASRTRARGGPKVFVVPGIMGSKIGSEGRFFDDALWFDPLEVAAGRLTKLALPDRAHTAIGVLLISYAQIYLRLRIAGYDVEYFPFDWRQDVEALGAEFAKKLDSTRGNPIVVAHSMGGLVTRAALAAKPSLKDKLARFVMLGTPNHGSFAPVMALDGVYPVVKTIAAIDLHHDASQLAHQVFVTFPGLLQMMPTPERFSALDLYDTANWPKHAATPPAAMLARAKTVQAKLSDAGPNAVLIAGINQRTVTSVAFESGAFSYTESFDGDGTVPLEFAQLSGVPTYFVEESHGSLPNNRAVMEAVVQLLARGETTVLSKQKPPTRRALRKLERSELERPAFDGRRGAEITEDELRHALDAVAAPSSAAGLAAPLPGRPERVFDGVSAVTPAGTFEHEFRELIVGRRRQRQLEIKLALGSITEVKTRAYVLGVFKDVEPAGPAAAIDQQLGGAVKEFTTRRMFSGNTGSTFVLPAGRSRLRADMVLFAGLGTFDGFDSEVQQFVAQNVVRTFVRTHVEDFATVVLGAGSGRSIATSLYNHLLGFFRGLADADTGHELRRITLCEFDEERFLEMKREIYRLASTDLFNDIQVTFLEEHLPAPVEVAPVTRAVVRREPPIAYLHVREEPGTARAKSSSIYLRSSLLTAGGKAAILSGSKEVESAKLAKHLERIEGTGFTFTKLNEFGAALASLVLDADVAKGLDSVRDCHLVVVHDATASQIPWETLRLGNGEAFFPAAEGGVSRRYDADNLSVAKWLEQRKDDQRLDVLLVVNPTGDLDGADEEAKRIEQLFPGSSAVRVEVVRGDQATRKHLLSLFRSGRFDALHYAGHAEFNAKTPALSGIVCANDELLTGADLAGLSSLPALVFFNACESARIRGRKQVSQRIGQSVGLAEAFLRGGVANYIGTYWPVGDDSAMTFAKTFYGDAVSGKSIGEALQNARLAVRKLKSVDWVDYIHYGSRDFVLKRRS